MPHPTKLGHEFCHALSSQVMTTLPRRRSTAETLESLRATLQKLEQSPAAAANPQSFSELKRVLLNRIAELELAQTLEASDPATDKAPDPADLVPLPAVVEENLYGQPTNDTDLEKLD